MILKSGLLKIFILITYMYVYMSAMAKQARKGDIRSPRAVGTGGCELPDMGAEE